MRRAPRRGEATCGRLAVARSRALAGVRARRFCLFGAKLLPPTGNALLDALRRGVMVPQQLALLAQDANWRVFQTPEYRHHSADFQRIAGDLTKAAKARNGDAAALAYVQLTMSCVNCHKYVRSVRMASAK